MDTYEDGFDIGYEQGLAEAQEEIAEKDKRIAELEKNVKQQGKHKADCIAFAQWFRSGNNRTGRTEDECWERWLVETWLDRHRGN